MPSRQGSTPAWTPLATCHRPATARALLQLRTAQLAAQASAPRASHGSSVQRRQRCSSRRSRMQSGPSRRTRWGNSWTAARLAAQSRVDTSAARASGARSALTLAKSATRLCDEALPVCAPHLWCPRRACLLTSLLGIWAMGARAACRAACEAFAVGPHWWLLLRGSSTCTRPPSRARAAPPHALLLLDSGVRSCTRSSR